MRRFLTLLVTLVVFGVGSALGQVKQVTGVVTSADDKQSIPGVSVFVKEAPSVGASTDINGKYTLKNVPANAKTIVFRFVGYTSVELPISATLDVALQSEAQKIDEVMVVAYGTAKKSAFTGSVAQINEKKLERKNVSEISKALAGEVAGVAIVNTSGQPGSNATIRIRGFGSVNASQSPLYIVDGVPFNGDISSISPSDIATTSVLKDATATAIYGARGANGVVLITTKKGDRNSSSIDVEVKTGWNMKLLPSYDVISNPEHFMELTWESMRNRTIAVGYDATPAGSLKLSDPAAYAAGFKAYWDANYAAAGVNASKYIFDGDNKGINSVYNMWKADGDKLIDPTTGKFIKGIERKYTPEDWEDNIFRTGKKVEASVKFSGGNEKTQYFSSFGINNDQGYYIGSDFSRLNARLNLNHKPKEWLKGGVNMAYSYMETNNPGQTSSANNGFYFVNNIPSIYPVFQHDDNGALVPDMLVGGNRYDYAFSSLGGRPFGDGINPAGAVRLDKKRTFSHQISATSNLEATLAQGLTLSTTFGTQVLANDLSSLTNPYYGDAAGLGRIYKEMNILSSYTWTQMLRYATKFDGGHNVNAFIAHEVTSEDNKYNNGQKDGLVEPGTLTWNNAVNMSSMNSYIVDYFIESYFGQVNYDYKEKYFVYGTIRRDGSSRFPNNRWGNFGAVGAAWAISSEDFMKQFEFIRSMKLKASYGILGNQDIGNYPAYNNYAIENLEKKPAFVYNYKGNMDLTWEKSKMFNVGLEFSLGNYIDGEVEYFRKNTDNLLFYKRVSPSIGFVKVPVNDGKLLNTGIEFNFTAHLVNTNDLRVDFRINGSHINNEMKRMPIDEATGKEKIVDDQGAYAYTKGHSLYDFYVREYAGVEAQTGLPQWNRYYYMDGANKVTISSMEEFLAGDKKGSKVLVEKTFDYNNATKKYIGKSAIPALTGGFGFDVSYKNFTLATQFLYSLGGYSYDNMYAGLMSNNESGGNNWSTDIEKRWQKPGDATSIPRLTNDYDKDGYSVSDRGIVKSNYLNLNNILLSYELPKNIVSKLSVKGASISVSGDNLWLTTKRKGYVPSTSVSGSNDSYRYSPLSTVSVGLKVQF